MKNTNNDLLKLISFNIKNKYKLLEKYSRPYMRFKLKIYLDFIQKS